MFILGSIFVILLCSSAARATERDGRGSGNTLPVIEGRFHAQRHTRELTFLVLKNDPRTILAVLDPAKRKHMVGDHGSNLKWYTSVDHDMITVNAPRRGIWQIVFISGTSGRIYLLVDVKLQSSFTNTAGPEGNVIRFIAWLTQGDEMLAEAAVLKHVAFSAEVKASDGRVVQLKMYDDGTHGDSVPGDGIYSNEFAAYREPFEAVRIFAEADSFSRSQTLVFPSTPSAPPVIPESVPAASVHDAAGPVQAPDAFDESVDWNEVFRQFRTLNYLFLAALTAVWMAGKIRDWRLGR